MSPALLAFALLLGPAQAAPLTPDPSPSRERGEGLSDSAGAPEPVTIDVLSFNTWGVPFPFSRGGRRGRLGGASAFLSARPADIVGLQELHGRSRDLLDHGPYAEVDEGDLQTGLALLSTLPMERRDAALFAPERPRDILTRKGYLHAVAALPNGVELQVFATHLEAGLAYERRQRAAQRLMDAVASTEGPAVVLGDFNLSGAERDLAVEQGFTQAGWRDVGADSGPTHRLLDQRLDRVYLRDGQDWCISPQTFQVLGDEHGAQRSWSDHHPVRARLMVEPCTAP
jgi:endonuclease/exonuclease/phosphatase family metal-dependent hydrolase